MMVLGTCPQAAGVCSERCLHQGCGGGAVQGGFCLPVGPYVTDEDVRYIVDCIKEECVNKTVRS